LFSFKPIKDKDNLIKELKVSLLKAKERGDDATGIAIINTETGKYEIYKKPVDANTFVSDKEFAKTIKNFGDFNLILGHTRAATQGTKDKNINNHPFYHRDTGSILTHNGTLWEYSGTIKQYDLKVDGECDSEIILSMYDKYMDFKKAMKRVHGNFAIALYHSKKLYLYKDSNPIVLVTDRNNTEDKLFYFATKESYIDNFFYQKSSFYNVFEIETKNEEMVTKELEREDLVEVDFENKKLKLTKEVESGVIDIKDKFNKEEEKGVANFFESHKGNTVKQSVLRNNIIFERAKGNLNEKVFESFLTQIKSTSKRMSDEQRTQLLGFIESLVIGDVNGSEIKKAEGTTENINKYDYRNGMIIKMVLKNIEIIEGKNDIVLTIIHDSIQKVRTRPTLFYSDEEKGLTEIASKINELTGATILINKTNIDMNSQNEFVDNTEVINEFKKVIEELNPKVILDLHGMANSGSLFNNSVNNGSRIFREVIEKPLEGERPDIDLEVRRKSGSMSMTSKGIILRELLKCLSLSGLITDIEAVYPGGDFIAQVSGKDRDVIAIEVAKRVREEEDKKDKIINGIVSFISYIRNEPVNIVPTTSFNVDKKMKELIEGSSFYIDPEGVDRYVG
jgi:predicted glutamine amidotransferase